MTQRSFETNDRDGNKIKVILGWDRPLQRFFMLIEDCEGELIYSNLDDKNCNHRLLYFRQKLEQYCSGDSIPEVLFADLVGDKMNDTGNLEATYDINGLVK